MKRIQIVAAAFGLSMSGCLGQIEDSSDPAAIPPPQTVDPDMVDVAQCALTVTPGRSPMRRLTRVEYDNTVRDLFAPVLGASTVPQPAGGFARDEEAGGFDNNADVLNVSPLLAEQYLRGAEELAGAAVADLNALLGCDVARLGEEPCVQAFIEAFGKRTVRRPLDPVETEDLLTFFRARRAEGDLHQAIRQTLSTMLQSPFFLYRVETGDPAGRVGDALPLTDYEVASRLSYFLWRSMPDDELMLLADSGELRDRNVIVTQARRMLEDPRARTVIGDFHRQWLEIGRLGNAIKDGDMYPEWTDSVRSAMMEETERFTQGVVLDEDGRLETLLTASFSYLNAELGAIYGIDSAGDSFERVELPAGQRSGLLTQASVLALHAKPDQSSPIHRGRFVREHLLCQTLPQPPAGLVVEAPTIEPGVSTRERFAQHSADPSCAGCHVMLDPVGFGFEHYDAIGRYRATDDGLEIDASGGIHPASEMFATDADGPFIGVLELGEHLAESRTVGNCVVTQWFRFSHGRIEEPTDACTVRELRDAFAASGFNIRELLVAFTQTDSFLYRPTE